MQAFQRFRALAAECQRGNGMAMSHRRRFDGESLSKSAWIRLKKHR